MARYFGSRRVCFIKKGVIMRCLRTCAAHAVILTSSILGTVVSGVAAGFIETDLVTNSPSGLTDSNGIVHKPLPCTTGTNPPPCNDPNLVNPWGLAASATSPFWVADNGKGVSTLYNVPRPGTAVTINPLVVSIPVPGGDPLGNGGHPTGVVQNIASASGAFPISGRDKNNAAFSAAASFIFATEDGTILGWNSAVFAQNDPVLPKNPSDPAASGPSTHAIIVVPPPPKGAVYKGLAIATDNSPTHVTRLYATNFSAGTVDVFDSKTWTPSNPGFTDPKLPRGYAPFNIVPIGSATGASAAKLVVTYAVQDAMQHDDVAGMSHGIVNTFDLGGGSLHRLIQHGQLNSPWGVALAPAGWGTLGNKLLIGNFGNGQINAYDQTTGELFDKMRNPHGQAIVIDGLWSIRFGSNAADNPMATPPVVNRNYGPNTLFFTAGPNDENDGLFGAINPSP